jgi:uncharacterized protein YdeI (YjbR/CyaY-like superfamily)
VAILKPIFFRSASEFRRWLEKYRETARDVWVGFYKKDSGRRGITYSEAVDQALCYGWIDGIKKRVDEERYTHRFSRRTSKSVWSNINIKRAEELTRLGLMEPPGLKAFETRDPARSGIYSFENRPKALTPALERRFKANKKAWVFFQAQPPGYRRLVIIMVMSAKQYETRERRLDRVMKASEKGLRLI